MKWKEVEFLLVLLQERVEDLRQRQTLGVRLTGEAVGSLEEGELPDGYFTGQAELLELALPEEGDHGV